MAKNDFDIDFDFEKEYGFDPKAILDSDYSDDDLDLSQFDDEALDMDLDEIPAGEFDNYDLDYAQEDADSAEDAFFDEDSYEAEPEEEAHADLDFEEEPYPDDADLTADMDFSRRASFFGVEETQEAPAAYEEPVFDDTLFEQDQDSRAIPEERFEAETEEETEETEEKPRRERTRRERKPVQLTMPPVFAKLAKLYFPTQQEITARREAGEGRDGRRRRKPTRQQIFKEFYLPTIILGLAVVLILSFVIGSVSNAIDRMQQERLAKEQQAQAESLAAEQLETEGKQLLAKAEVLAMGYNYDEAIRTLDSYMGEPSQEMTAKRAEYVNAKSTLVEYQDPTLIPNLSFHMLIADPARAIADDEYGGLYNKNFVTTSEFEKILNQLYMANFVLVDFNSFVGSNSMDGTSSSLFPVAITLPEGKKPVMITQTQVNYYNFMIDSNSDGVADGGGAGFASKLVVDANGDIKAEYVDASNVTNVGNYDLVPILEDFIEQHPDFSYRGARATLAVSGHEGIFGYRIQSESIATKGQDYYNEQVVGATKVVEALKEKGYRLACYSFKDISYSNINAAMILEDIQKWKSQISPVIGELDTIVFAKMSDIGDYTGGKFDVLLENGFRIMIKNADTPYTEVNNNYVRQSRLMVTGENMLWKGSMFTDNGLFDPNTVLDLTARGGSIPTG